MNKELLGSLELNRAYQLDCLEGMKLLPDRSIDMILCDLPYGTTACKWDSIIPFEPLWEQYERIIKENGAIVLTAAQPFTSSLIMSNPKLFRHELIWDKLIGGAFVLVNKRILPAHENILIFYKKQPTYNPQMEDKEKSKIRPENKGSSKGNAIPVASGVAKSSSKYDKTKKFPTSVIKKFSAKMAECNSLNRVHPTQKPVALFEYLIKTYSNEGDIVLDNCIGSGSTLLAAINTGRNYIGFELEEEYYKLASERIKKHKYCLLKNK